MAAAAKPGGIPYIGSRISLISKSEIRYEGTLYTIDTQNSTVALQKVRSFGTEGRRQNGRQIPPSPEVYDYIIFRGSDIKDLHVSEAPKAQAPPDDPAIISSAAPPPAAAPAKPAAGGAPADRKFASAPVGVPGANNYSMFGNAPSNNPWGEPAAAAPAANQQKPKPKPQQRQPQQRQQQQRQQQQRQQQRQPRQQQQQNARMQSGAAAKPQNAWGAKPKAWSGAAPAQQRQQRGGKNMTTPGMGGHLRKARLRGAQGGPAAVPKSEFDFEDALKTFEAKKEEAPGANPTPVAGKEAKKASYKKDDFFDTISCDAYDKLEALKQGVGVRKQNYRERMAEESKTNMQTFGAVSLNTNRGRNNRNYGGRGRGGRGPGPQNRNYNNANRDTRNQRSRSDNSRNWRQRGSNNNANNSFSRS